MNRGLEMKKIGIITTSSGGNGNYRCNYGAALQGYALVKQLRLLGYDAYDINYHSDNEYSPEKYSVFQRTLKRIQMLTNYNIVRAKLIEIINRKNLASWKDKFFEFVIKNNLTYNQGEFFNILQLREVSKEFYAVICGSDVVWNPALRNNVCDDGYFLNFAAEGVKRIAYAPSFGVSDLPKDFAQQMGKILPSFTGLSVREKTGQDLVKKYCGLDAKVVLDPTLLLPTKEYESQVIVPEWLPSEYIAVYQFGDIQHTSDKIKEIRDKYKLPLVIIPARYEDFTKATFDIGPGEFLGIIKNAKLVLSDSFHCTVFSLLYHTPFLTFYRNRPMPGKDINSRMLDLLKLVDLEDRLVPPDTDINYNSMFDLGFEKSDEIIEIMRQDSLTYLKSALEG